MEDAIRVAQGIGDRGHIEHRSLDDANVAAGAGGRQVVSLSGGEVVEHRALDDANVAAGAGGRQVVTLSGGEVVEHRHRMAVRDEVVHQVAADEAGSTGNERALAHVGNQCPMA